MTIKLLTLLTASALLVSCGSDQEGDEESTDSGEPTEEATSDESDADAAEGEAIEFSYRQLSSEEFAGAFDDPDAVILDVRTPGEWEENGVLEGAITLDWYGDDFEAGLEEQVGQDQSVFIYCHGGGRGSEAAERLIELGYHNVYNLENGLSEWIEEGRDVISYDPN